jgi:hypothetical protein
MGLFAARAALGLALLLPACRAPNPLYQQGAPLGGEDGVAGGTSKSDGAPVERMAPGSDAGGLLPPADAPVKPAGDAMAGVNVEPDARIREPEVALEQTDARAVLDSTASGDRAADTAPDVLSETRNGLKGEYFNHLDFTELKLTRVDPMVNFEWGYQAPDERVGAETFSVRWTGQVLPRYSETYTFHTITDDGGRLWIDGKLIIDNWRVQSATEKTGTIALEAGRRYDIKMEYFENEHIAVAKLLWSSPSQEKQIVPSTQLFAAP